MAQNAHQIAIKDAQKWLPSHHSLRAFVIVYIFFYFVKIYLFSYQWQSAQVGKDSQTIDLLLDGL